MTVKEKLNAPTTGHIPPLQRPEFLNVIDFVKTFDDVEDYIEDLESFEYSFIYRLYKEGLPMEDKDFNHWFFIRELIRALRKDWMIKECF